MSFKSHSPVIVPQENPFTEDLIKTLRTWDVAAAANAYDARARRIDANVTAAFVELGLIVKEVKDRELWKHITCWKTGEACHSWDEWVHDALPEWSNGTVYSALGCAEDLKDIPVAQRCRIRRGNQEVLRKLPPAARKEPPVLEYAVQMPPREFLSRMQRDHPESHIQSKMPYRFSPTDDQRYDIDMALAAIMDWEKCTRDEALHQLAVDWLDSPCGYWEHADPRQEMVNDPTNREAIQREYERKHGGTVPEVLQ